MIKTNANYSSLKAMRDKEKAAEEAAIKEACNALANERYTEKQMKQWSVENKGLWFLPILGDNGNIEKLGIFKPVDRVILSFASTKVQDEGLYSFLEAAMRECWIAGDEDILNEDEYFLSAANKFNAIVEGKKALLLKR